MRNCTRHKQRKTRRQPSQRVKPFEPFSPVNLGASSVEEREKNFFVTSHLISMRAIASYRQQQVRPPDMMPTYNAAEPTRRRT